MLKYIEILMENVLYLKFHDGTYLERAVMALFNIPFKWYISNDDNRNQDALDLRERVGGMYDVEIPMGDEASCLEVLIALAERMNGDFGFKTAGEWFKIMLDNLSLLEYSMTSEELKIRIWRDRGYNPDGYGGIFPLNDPNEDQRKVEIWYQMYAYIEENYPN